MLPAGYTVGFATQQLFGWGFSAVSAVGNKMQSTVGYFRKPKSGSITGSKDVPAATGDKNTSDAANDDVDSPKISTDIENEEKESAELVQ